MVDSNLELARLLCTRLCHDLAGPVSAVAAGVELIGNDPEQADEETLGLIGDSSTAASRKLKFMRAALGVAMGSADDIKGLLDGYLDATASMGGRVEVRWPQPSEMSEVGGRLGAEANQVVLNLCLLAMESQPGCRDLTLSVSTDTDRTSISAEVTGDPARSSALRDDILGAATGSSDQPITAKTVQAFVTGQLVRSLGGTLALSAQENGVRADVTFSDSRP